LVDLLGGGSAGGATRRASASGGGADEGAVAAVATLHPAGADAHPLSLSLPARAAARTAGWTNSGRASAHAASAGVQTTGGGAIGGAGAALARPPSRPVDDGESAADPDDRRAAVTVSEGEGEGAQVGGRIVRGDNGSK
jgi:hypothetical protein